jgi:predicted ATPase with chaperone activity
MIRAGRLLAPKAPANVLEAGIDPSHLTDLALKVALTVPQFTAEWAADRMKLPVNLVESLLQQLTKSKMLEILGSSQVLTHRYTISQRGGERAEQLMRISGYVGPAPVSLDAYTAMLEWQLARFPEPNLDEVRTALTDLVLPDNAIELAGLAASSGRSLFLFGPAGNGKTTLGRLLHQALKGEFWLPHAIAVDSSVVRIYDPHCHELANGLSTQESWGIDNRWVRVHRPLVVVGGELTLESLDFAYNPALRYYEAPLHLKSNGGTLLVDDFGRQHVDPHDLLNRWIVPMEHGFDYLTLHTGQQIQVPFRQMLIIATNLDPGLVTDAAFLRRLGYRLQLAQPSPERYAEILTRYASHASTVATPDLVSRILERYKKEDRELRCCEPRDLVDRVRDICKLRGQGFELTDELLDRAWTGYFGEMRVTE